MRAASLRLSALEWLVLLAPLGIVIVAGLAGATVRFLTMDMLAVTKTPPWTGFLSNLGILVLAASTAIWAFAARVHDRADPTVHRHLLTGALVSGYMTLDDLFQVHDLIAPVYFGIRDEIVLALLALALLYFSWLSWRDRERAGFAWLIVSLSCLAASLFVDLVSPWLWRLGDWQYLLEDGLKWMALCFWLKYAWVHARWRLQPRHAQPA